MDNNRSSLSLFFVLFLLVRFISAAPTKPGAKSAPAKSQAHKPAAGKTSCPSKLHRRGRNVFLGYNGFNGTPHSSVVASAGGELGAVFYTADSEDLTKSFARGVDHTKDYVCIVYADAYAWATQSKVWVGHGTTGHGGNAVNSAYVGSVLFASHTAASLPATSPAAVNQMGIRQSQIFRLGVHVQCFAKSCFDTDHHSLNYATLKTSWHIQSGK